MKIRSSRQEQINGAETAKMTGRICRFSSGYCRFAFRKNLLFLGERLKFFAVLIQAARKRLKNRLELFGMSFAYVGSYVPEMSIEIDR